MLVTPHVSAAWQHAFGDITPDTSLTFAASGIGFTVYGVPLAKDSPDRCRVRHRSHA